MITLGSLKSKKTKKGIRCLGEERQITASKKNDHCPMDEDNNHETDESRV